MKIKKELPQFENNPSLLIVLGRQSAEFYLAKNGLIDKKNEINIETPRYSDREGRFEMRGQGQTYSSGAVYEDNKGEIRNRFLNKLKETTEQLNKETKIETVFIFSPDYNLKLAQDHLPQALQEKVRFTFDGNFKKTHPLKLLERIEEKIQEKIVDIPPRK